VRKIKARDLAEKLGCEVRGDGEVLIRGAAGIDSATEGDLTFLASPKARDHFTTTAASVIIARKEMERDDVTLIVSANPALTFAQALWVLYPRKDAKPGVSPLAYVAEGAKISEYAEVMAFAHVGAGAVVNKGCIIYPGVVLGDDSEVGEESILYPSVTVYDGCVIGKRVIIHSGAVIGADGFGFVMEGDRHLKIPQIGTVVIEDDVEIGALSAVDRAALGETRVKKGTKIDNLVQVGHNVTIGQHSILASQTGISGSVKIGDYVMLGGQTGVAGHLEIDSGIMVGAKSGIPQSLSSKECRIWSGIPVMDHRKWRRLAVSLDRFPDLIKKVRKIEKELEKLSGDMEGKVG